MLSLVFCGMRVRATARRAEGLNGSDSIDYFAQLNFGASENTVEPTFRTQALGGTDMLLGITLHK